MNKAQRWLVVWGAVVLALVLHLVFYRWGWSLYWSERHHAASLVFGFLVPLTLVGVAGFVHFGGRKDDGREQG